MSHAPASSTAAAPSSCSIGRPRRSSDEVALVAPRAHRRVDTGAGDEEERERVSAREMAQEPPAEIDDEEADRAVEHPLLPRRPGFDLPTAEVAPEEVADDLQGREQDLLSGRCGTRTHDLSRVKAAL